MCPQPPPHVRADHRPIFDLRIVERPRLAKVRRSNLPPRVAILPRLDPLTTVSPQSRRPGPDEPPGDHVVRLVGRVPAPVDPLRERLTAGLRAVQVVELQDVDAVDEQLGRA